MAEVVRFWWRSGLFGGFWIVIRDSCLCHCQVVVGHRLSSPQRYHGNRSNVVGDYVHVDAASQHLAGKVRPESPTLEDYVIIPHVDRGPVEDGLTTGQLDFIYVNCVFLLLAIIN